MQSAQSGVNEVTIQTGYPNVDVNVACLNQPAT